MKTRHQIVLEKQWFPYVMFGGAFATALLIASFILVSDIPFFPPFYYYTTPTTTTTTSPQLHAILHYATSHEVPQQSLSEIRVSFDVLKSLSPCNFLVFGLGHDSLMWSSFNPQGTTLFLEEDPRWVQKVLKKSPFLRARAVRYPTRLSQADDLLQSYRSERDCLFLPMSVVGLRKSRCRLAITTLPREVYETEWDLIMIDAPRGYFEAAPGRMGAIFTAAAMARGRVGEGVTHVFLHDVNRRVERIYAEEFLCKKYLVKAVGRLWHFQIPPANDSDSDGTTAFC